MSQQIDRPQIPAWIVIGGLLLIIAVVVLIQYTRTPDLDIPLIQDRIESWAESTYDLDYGSTFVSCPGGQPAREDHAFICTITDPSGEWSIRVDVLNSNGDIQWELLG